MSKIFIISAAFILLFSAVSANAERIMQITIDGGIGAGTAAFISSAVEEATEEDYEAVIIRLNTPGGLLEATRDIVETILEADIPVIVYVSPGGARAGSAGVFITLAAHIAAMSEGTNIGAAHPVGLGGEESEGVMSDKITNDAAAFARTIAQKHGRNVEWAEKAVRESISSTEQEAFLANAIDVIAPDIDSLLRYAHNKSIAIKSGDITIKTLNPQIITREMNWRESLLSFLSDPNIAYILILVGAFGIIFEVKSPGAIFPGVIGGISILIAAYSLQMIPINLTGLLLLILGIVLFIIEVFVTSYGILTIGGIISFVLGSIMLIDSPLEFMQISMGLIVTVTIMLTLFVVFLAYFGVKAQFAKRAVGETNFAGEKGTALEDFKAGENGNIKIHGEIWRAKSDTDITKDDQVIVAGAKGFTLIVKKEKQ